MITVPRLVCASELPRELVKYTNSQDPIVNLIRPGNLKSDQLPKLLLCSQLASTGRELNSSSGSWTVPSHEDKDSVQQVQVTQNSPFISCWWEGSSSGGGVPLHPEKRLLPKYCCIKDSKVKKGLQSTLYVTTSTGTDLTFYSVTYFVSREIYARIGYPWEELYRPKSSLHPPKEGQCSWYTMVCPFQPHASALRLLEMLPWTKLCPSD